VAKKTQPPANRREKIEEMRQQQRAADRRRTLIIVVAAVVLAGGLIAAAAVPLIRQTLNDPARKDWSEFGVAAADASCDDAVEEPTSGSSDHRPDGEAIEYDPIPPSSGPHYNVPAPFTRKFYTPDDAAEIERLVHNLEHGYTILWYDPAVLDDQRATLRDLAVKVAEGEDVQEETSGKFIVAPWDAERGELPDDASYVLTHWGAEQGFRQQCGELSGEVVRDFVTAHPSSDSPEPFGG
jgi:hypothetical protein